MPVNSVVWREQLVATRADPGLRVWETALGRRVIHHVGFPRGATGAKVGAVGPDGKEGSCSGAGGHQEGQTKAHPADETVVCPISTPSKQEGQP